MSRKVTKERSEDLGRPTLAGVSRETGRWARWHDRITAIYTALVPATNMIFVGATGTAHAGLPVPLERLTLFFEDHVPRALECRSQEWMARFPVEPHMGASQTKPALHEGHQVFAQAS